MAIRWVRLYRAFCALIALGEKDPVVVRWTTPAVLSVVEALGVLAVRNWIDLAHGPANPVTLSPPSAVAAYVVLFVVNFLSVRTRAALQAERFLDALPPSERRYSTWIAVLIVCVVIGLNVSAIVALSIRHSTPR